MEDDTPDADETDARAAHDGPERIPVHVPDRFEKTVRDDHASNAALHSVLRTDDDFASVNLMGSHAPGENPRRGRPRYHVRITIENPAMGEPSTGSTVIDELAERGDVRILKAYGGARYDDVTVEDETGRGNDATPDDVVDAVEGTIEGAVDYITVHVRPVEKTVEPVTITSNDLPREYVDIGDVEHTAARTLRKVIDEHGVDSDRAHEAARSLATVVAVHGDPDEDPGHVFNRLWSTAGADPETGETSAIRPVDDGFLFEAPDEERTRPFRDLLADDFIDRVGGTGDDQPSGFIDVLRDADGMVNRLGHAMEAVPSDEGVVYPQTRPPVEPIREWVEEHKAALIGADIDAETTTDVADQIADAIERYNLYGTTDPAATASLREIGDPNEDTDDAVAELAKDRDKIPIVCGCGEYAVDVPAGKTPDAIDVVCPECSNHFGHDTDGVTSVESPGDPFDLDTARYPDVAEAILSACDQYEDDTEAPGAPLPFVIDDVIAEYRTSAVLWEAFRMYATGEVYSPKTGAIRRVEPPDTSDEDTVAGDE